MSCRVTTLTRKGAAAIRTGHAIVIQFNGQEYAGMPRRASPTIAEQFSGRNRNHFKRFGAYGIGVLILHHVIIG
jgi:hypothetical protein